jgi:hypothetical protein
VAVAGDAVALVYQASGVTDVAFGAHVACVAVVAGYASAFGLADANTCAGPVPITWAGVAGVGAYAGSVCFAAFLPQGALVGRAIQGFARIAGVAQIAVALAALASAVIPARNILAGVGGVIPTTVEYCNRKDRSKQICRFHGSSPVNVKILVFGMENSG